MKEQGSRLRTVRVRAGFASAEKAASALGVTASTYRAHENGQNGYGLSDARIYARKFGCDPYWLMDGQEPHSPGGHSDLLLKLTRDFEALDASGQAEAIAKFAAILTRRIGSDRAE